MIQSQIQTNASFKIGIVAGEASGDLLGAKLISALHERCPHLAVEGIGGPAMIAAGCHSLFDIERLSVMGLVEPLLRLPELFNLRRELMHHFLANKPDVFIGIDAPDFNIALEMKLKHAGIPVVHYVSPSVWAWRQKRVYKIKKAVDLILTLLPFETKFYEQYQVPVHYVGHPLAEEIPLHPDVAAARRALCIDEHGTYIALLPGSRSQEIRYMAETLLRAAHQAWQERPHLQFLTAHVNEQRYQEFYDCYQKYTPDLPLQFFTRRSQDVMAAADVVVVTSGTATLETMLYKKPMIIVYKMSKFTFQLAKWLVKTPNVGLPNLLAHKTVVPELIQDNAKPETIVQSLFDYLDHPEKVEALQQKFTEIHQSLRFDCANSIADSVFRVAKH